ncbi:MAG: hypothetical protein AAF468_02550 [Pseudomonadota bacterium]
MWAVRRSSFRAVPLLMEPSKVQGAATKQTFGTVLVALIAGLSLSACTSSGGNGLETALKPKPADTKVEKAALAPPKAADADKKKAGASKTAVSTTEFDPLKRSNDLNPNDSAWCRYIKAQTGVDTTLLRSPTVSAQINNDGDAGVSVGYDVLDLERARLKEKKADAQCRRYLAVSQLSQVMFVSPQSLTRTGFLARANSLRRDMGNLNVIRNAIRNHVRVGNMTQPRANGLLQYLNQVKSAEAQARAESVRRDSIDRVNAGGTLGLDKRLRQAERDIQLLNRKLRSIDALKFEVTAGYNQREIQDLNSFDSDDLYGKVKVSYRLGAASPKRHAYEDAAMQARLEALDEPRRGSLWRAGELADAYKRATSALINQRNQLVVALREARKNARIFSRSFEVELLGPKVRAQIDVIRLKADIAALDATLKDLKRVDRNLRFKQPG